MIITTTTTTESLTTTPNESKRHTRSLRNNNNPVGNPAPSFIDDSVIDSDIVMILSKLDEESYQQSLSEDTEQLLQNRVFPKCFPWHDARAPLLRFLARDIDDMPGILFAEDEIICPFGTQAGYFGYGRFESGMCRKKSFPTGFGDIISELDYSTNIIHSDPSKYKGTDTTGTYEGLLSRFEKVYSVARRSADVGVIELTVMMPPPPSTNAALVYCQKYGLLPDDPSMKHDELTIQKAKAIVEGERAEVSKCMPLYWTKGDKNHYFNPPAFIDEEEENTSLLRNYDPANPLQSSSNQVKKRKYAELSQKCMRKWNVSIKVGGVSSRSTLFDRTVHKKEQNDTQDSFKRKRRPFIRIASFPSSIQTGKTVSVENAAQLDEQGITSYLGSYDCRATTANTVSYNSKENNKQSKKDKDIRPKRINVGRTRLIWTSTQPKFDDVISTRSKNMFFCNLTGQKLDAAGYKRPREALVTVKLNGSVIREVISEEKVTNSDTTKEQHRKLLIARRLKQDDLTLNKIRYGNMTARSEEIEQAILSTTFNIENSSSTKKKLNSDYKRKANPICSLDTQELLTSMIVSAEKRSKKRRRSNSTNQTQSENQSQTITESIVPMKFGGATILKHTPPEFTCLPVDDGFLRVKCTKLGSMQGSPIHNLLNLASQREVSPGSTCSVCWSGDGIDGSDKVMVCVDCNISVHLGCCLDQGEFIDIGDETTSTVENYFGNEALDAINQSSEGNATKNVHWRCSVCASSKKNEASTPQNDFQNSNRKSGRSSRMPSRFAEGTRQYYSTTQRKTTKPRPNHKCSLCPHSGGAMSKSDLLDADNKSSSIWTHEVCRIWCGSTNPPITKDLNRDKTKIHNYCTGLFQDYSESSCVICGIGNIQDDGREKDDAIKPLTPDEEMTDNNNKYRNSSLVKCAAKGCMVVFHPMCALLVSKLRVENSNLDSLKAEDDDKFKDLSLKETEELKKLCQNDLKLCQQYSLDIVELKRYEGAFGSIRGQKKTCLIPVAFCGYHNSNRDPSLYGCPPAGGIISSHMRVPVCLTVPNHNE